MSNNNPLIATPIIEEFPQFIDSTELSPRIERYLWFPGDIIGSRRKQEMRDLVAMGLLWKNKPLQVLRNGGEEFGTPALARTKGFVPKAFITPLEIAAYWVVPQAVADGAATFRGVANAPETTAGMTAYVGRPGALVGEQVLPGHAASWILSAASNDQGYRRGVVELTSLRGVKWDEGSIAEIQHLYFPDYPTLPNTLSALEEMIRRVLLDQSGDIREIGEQMLNGCDEFRTWGTARLQDEFTLVQTGTTPGGYTYRYSELARSLMEQLEITPQDQQLTQVARLQEQVGKSVLQMAEIKGADQNEIVKALLTNQQQIAAVLAAISDRLPAPSTQTAQTAQTEPVTAAQPEKKKG